MAKSERRLRLHKGGQECVVVALRAEYEKADYEARWGDPKDIRMAIGLQKYLRQVALPLDRSYSDLRHLDSPSFIGHESYHFRQSTISTVVNIFSPSIHDEVEDNNPLVAMVSVNIAGGDESELDYITKMIKKRLPDLREEKISRGDL